MELSIGDDCDVGLLAPRSTPSTFDIFCMTSFNFPFGAICSPMGIVLLPLEATHLFPDASPIALGCMMGIVGISQLVCPIAGKISDNCRCKMGKRRPFIHLGNFISIASLMFMWWASESERGFCFLFGLFIAMVFLNVAYSSAGGLVPDLVPEELQGKSSGMVGVNLLSGAVAGFVFLMVTYHHNYHYNYAFYAILLTLCSILIHCKSKEQSTAGLAPIRVKLENYWKCYVIDTTHGYDFFWVFISRTLYYTSVSCQSFFLYYVRDIIHIESESNQKLTVGGMGLLAQFCGALVTYPVGKLSDGKLGRKKLVYFACIIMALVYTSILLVPYAGPSSDFVLLFLVMVIYGCGNGAFLSVDYAIALDCIPDRTQTAQSLGVWGLSAFVGLAIGPLMWGATLEISRLLTYTTLPLDAFPYSGYVVMLVGGCLTVFAAGRSIYYVDGTR